ncbi:MAG: B12-binding domain-containing radical SAM protein [Nanoarchaeota archaeon]
MGFVFIQLPFPTTEDINLIEQNYLKIYSSKYKKVFPDFFIPEKSLWELPLWIAFLSAKLSNYERDFINLSTEKYDKDILLSKIKEKINDDDILLFSPLTQNYNISKNIINELNNKIIIGGNMCKFFDDDFGKLKNVFYSKEFGFSSNIINKFDLKLSENEFDLELLSKEFTNIPLLRLFTHHGCPYKCIYCGDLSSKKIIEIEKRHIKKQLSEYKKYYPNVKILYIGDKTFNIKDKYTDILVELLENEDYELIVQTRPEHINKKLIEKMKKINVKVVELGFESANKNIREKIRKPQKIEDVKNAIKLLEDNDIKVIINVLFGIPYETDKTYQETLDFLKNINVWLINGYIFVPYPQTEMFDILKNENRIIENNFDYWCENKKLVFKPYNIDIDKHYNWYKKILSYLTNIENF